MAVRNAQRRERRGTAAEWAAVNPILKAGELGILQDGDGQVQEIRVGDGTSAWADLGDTALLPRGELTARYAALVDGKVDPDQLPDIDALPAGGDTGDVLAKASGDDGDAEWVDLTATSLVVVNAGSNLSTARPTSAGAVYWMFDNGTDPGDAGENITNGAPGDMWFVADA